MSKGKPDISGETFYVDGLGTVHKKQLEEAAKEGKVLPSTKVLFGETKKIATTAKEIVPEFANPVIIKYLRIIGVLYLILSGIAGIVFWDGSTHPLTKGTDPFMVGLGFGAILQGILFCVLLFALALIVENLIEIKINTASSAKRLLVKEKDRI